MSDILFNILEDATLSLPPRTEVSVPSAQKVNSVMNEPINQSHQDNTEVSECVSPQVDILFMT